MLRVKRYRVVEYEGETERWRNGRGWRDQRKKVGRIEETEGRKVRRARQTAQVMIALTLWWVGVRV